jgi:hypothetical protein
MEKGREPGGTIHSWRGAGTAIGGSLDRTHMERVAGLTVVQMFREADAPKGRNRFSCPMPVWELLWELGQAFGWHPKGTTYVLPAKSRVEAPARRDYQPGSVQDHKQVEAADAIAWARALEVAKASPHAAAMIEARSAAFAGAGKGTAEPLPGVIDEFIEFAYGGAFEFAICGDAR